MDEVAFRRTVWIATSCCVIVSFVSAGRRLLLGCAIPQEHATLSACRVLELVVVIGSRDQVGNGHGQCSCALREEADCSLLKSCGFPVADCLLLKQWRVCPSLQSEWVERSSR